MSIQVKPQLGIHPASSSTLFHVCNQKQTMLSIIKSRPLNPMSRFISLLTTATTTPPSFSTSPSKTPLQNQFETWINHLKPGFTPSDVHRALQAQLDPDLSLDVFRWTAQQRNYTHTHLTYLTVIKQLIASRRYRQAETLIHEVIAGACEPSVELFNAVIRFCCGRKFLFSLAFDVYKKMLKSEDSKPTLETYSLLFNSLLRRFNKLNVCYVYLHSVRSMTKQMKANGVIPDTFVLNMIIKAYSKCLELDEAIKVFREMGLYGCEKGRVNQGFKFLQEMRGKSFVPSASTYVVIICSLSMNRRFEDAIEVLFDMLENSKSPGHLTYKTVLEGLCREGRADEAFDLLDECRKRDVNMNENMYKALLRELHYICREGE
ncbi:pentatricopeptide repeat-containing protein At3g25210, mitochondrial-like [Arachis stenosperma]|uniref:pentatricopeptide repeat-containing protein At3g25210, mitochondrial-like n=1 Tax=Arachis stenosperma TaxID=217475 RepID=UPI0025AD6496|nr:pentatricopeptide repeat-containing protein At3g25210, mitochondrial-like [Arachis stenosperma]